MFTNQKYYGYELYNILILFGLAAFALIWFSWTRKKYLSSKPPLPPGPHGLPLVGYLPFLSSNIHHDYSALAKVYGPIFKFWMGTKLCVVITSPQLIGQVVREQDIVFANRNLSICSSITTYAGHDIAFASYGPEWKNLRKIFIREMSSNTKIDIMYGVRRGEVRKSIRYLFENINTPVDIGRLAFQTTMDTVINMTIGASLEGDDVAIDIGQFKKAVEDLVLINGKFNISDVFPVLKWFDIQGMARESTKIFQMFEAVFDKAIAKRKNTLNDPVPKAFTRKDFLQYLMELHEDQTSETPITITEIKALLTDTFLAATDTTTTTVEWAMAEILNKPVVLNKIQEELKQVVGLNNNVEDSHLSKLTYLNAVLKETLRLHPPVPFLVPRKSSQSAIVGGYTIPKGATIFLNVWSMQRDPNVWNNSLEFLPERFCGDKIQGDIDYNFSGHQNFNYLPFGSGRRICAGISLGEKMVMHLLASFMHCFDWKLPVGTKVEFLDKFGLVLKKQTPLAAIPTPRFSDIDIYLH
uniref:Cytochrome P450 n=1 Tax=Cannabis sativa TaxID=3483 RepID=A0A803Q5V1_CANSA